MIKSNPYDRIMFRNDVYDNTTEHENEHKDKDKQKHSKHSISSKDLKFYRKRVFDHVHLLHKHLFTCEPVKAVPPNVTDAYAAFVKEMIDYLKTRDEIEFYSKKNDNKHVICTETPIQKVDVRDINRETLLAKRINTKPTKNSSMSNYVIPKSTRKHKPVISYPKQMEFNPYDLKLKNKRIIQNGNSKE